MIITTGFKDLLIIQNKDFKDQRGYFKELLRENQLNKKFPFVVMSFSKKNVIRGLHIQNKNSQGKFVSVIKGKIFDVVLDLRPTSPTFKQSISTELSADNYKMNYIPKGCAHGFQTLEDNSEILYLISHIYDSKSSQIVRWNDDLFKINWSLSPTIMSKRDSTCLDFLY